MTAVCTRDEYTDAMPGRDACAGSMPGHEVPGRNVSTEMSTDSDVSAAAVTTATTATVASAPVTTATSASAATGRGSVGGKRQAAKRKKCGQCKD
jgi:hypothetical protein